MAYTLDCTIYGSSQATGLAIFLRADPGVETIVAPPVLAPHDFSNPYLRMGREGPLLCCRCGTYGPGSCDPSRISVPVQTYVESCKDAGGAFFRPGDWSGPPRQRLPMPDVYQRGALVGGAWDLASSERRDGTRGRRR